MVSRNRLTDKTQGFPNKESNFGQKFKSWRGTSAIDAKFFSLRVMRGQTSNFRMCQESIILDYSLLQVPNADEQNPFRSQLKHYINFSTFAI